LAYYSGRSPNFSSSIFFADCRRQVLALASYSCRVSAAFIAAPAIYAMNSGDPVTVGLLLVYGIGAIVAAGIELFMISRRGRASVA
jgi:hypothetical protein